MKKLSIIFLILTSFHFHQVHAQRNANQNRFKKKSLIEYQNRGVNSAIQSSSNLNRNQQRFNNPNEIVFEVNALFNARADKFLAVFNLTQIGKNAIETNQLINKRIDQFTEDLQQLAIPEKDIYVDMIYLIPTFEFAVEKKLFSSATYNEVPTGFEMQKNIHVSFNDINKIDNLVTLAAKNEIYDLVKLDFFVDDTEAIYDTLRTKCQSFLTKSISSHESSLRLNLKDQYHVMEEGYDAIYPETQYSDYDAFVTQSLEAVKKNSGVTKIRKPETVAYDQVPYENFQIIVNPDILEPVVQYTYRLKVTYSMEKKKPVTAKKKYMLVTPNGDVKELVIE